MPVPADLVYETATVSGTGNQTLGAVNGKQTFNQAFGTGGTDLFDYYISSRDQTEWEHGTGHLSDATTLVRDTVLQSSNADAAVNFTSATGDVTNDVSAINQMRLEGVQTVTGVKTFSAANEYGTPAGVVLTNATGLPTAGLVDDAVTYAKIQDVVADERLLGNIAGAAQPVVELTPAQVLTMLNVEAGATADQTGAQIKVKYEAEANAFTDTKNTKLTGIETSADVTDVTNVTAAGALMDSEVDADLKTLALPANTTISAFGATLVDDAAASNARTTIGCDPIGTDNTPTATVTTAGKGELATSAEYQGNDTGPFLLESNLVWAALAEVTLTDAASIVWDMSGGIDFVVTITANRTLANASGETVGKKGRIRVVQDAGGTNTLAFGTDYEFAGGTAPVVAAGASAQSMLYYDVISTSRIVISAVLDIS